MISDRTAPRSYSFDFAADTSLERRPDGSVAVLGEGGQQVGAIDRPWAIDAAGKKVATNYRVQGDTLVQVVAHDVRGITYPVVADPTVHWWGVRWELSKSRTDKLILAMNSGAGTAGIIAAVCGGTIAGAIPCGAGYGVFASLTALGSGFISYCNRGSKGIILRYTIGVGFNCSKR